ncbi:MAG: hypothetical protein KC668_29120 [Myxococcales bacterium]|nr:hypothetical protein [Myxococcales bacterium]
MRRQLVGEHEGVVARLCVLAPSFVDFALAKVGAVAIAPVVTGVVVAGETRVRTEFALE